MDYLKYKGSVEYSREDNCLVGKAQGMGKDLIAYEGQTLDELRQAVRGRVLPENPLEEVLRMNYTGAERSLMAIAPRLSKLQPTVDNAERLASMTEHYLPLSHISICYEDNLWRDHILKNLRKAARLKLDAELKRSDEGENVAFCRLVC